MFYSHSGKKGFTLIELIVAITILSILAAVATGSYFNSLKQARDARKKADLEQIRQALELYRNDDTTGQYPSQLTDLLPQYLPRLPINPSSKQPYNNSNYRQSGTSYELSVVLEKPKDGSGSCSGNPTLFSCSDPCVYCVDSYGEVSN